MTEEIKTCDVSDLDPVTLPPKDCRYYNGGAVATEEEQLKWERETESEELTEPIIFIDRLRE